MLNLETNFLKVLELAPENAPTAALQPGREFIWALAVLKCSAAKANCELGELERTKASAIIQAAREMMDGRWDDLFVVDPAQAGPAEYPHIINTLIAARAVQILHTGPGFYPDNQVVDPEKDVNKNQDELEVLCAAVQLGCLKGLEKLSQAWDSLLPETRADGLLTEKLPEDGRINTYNFIRLFNAAESLNLISWQSAAKEHPTLPSKMIKYLRSNAGYSLRLADHTAGSMKTLAGLDSFSSSLRQLLSDFRYKAQKLHQQSYNPVGMGLKTHSLPGMLEAIRCKLQVCDLAITLAAQNGTAERKIILPVAGYLLLEVLQRLSASTL
jgi:fumarate hydratase class II